MRVIVIERPTTTTLVPAGTSGGTCRGPQKMRFTVLTIAAAALLLAACETTPRETAATDATPTGMGTGTQRLGAPAPGSQEELAQTIGDRIFFDFDSYAVRADQRRTVELVAGWMNQHQNVQMTIEGHADERGTREYNLALADRRANSVRDLLVSQGVSSQRLSTISYGKERPEVLGSNDYAWQQNRRGVFVVR